MTRRSIYLVTVPALILLMACSALGGAAAPTSVPVLEPTPTVETATQQESIPEQPEAAPTMEHFLQELLDALSAPRDYEGLTRFMGDSFEILIWYGSGEQMAPSEAVRVLREVFLPPDNVLTYNLDADLATLIGTDPFEFYPQAVGFALSQGWGAGGGDEAILVINQNPDGSFYWSSILLANGGFAANPPPAPAAGWHPPDITVCQDLQVSVAGTLGVTEVELEGDAPFEDYLGGTSGTGCLLTVNGTGVDFENFFDVFLQLKTMLEGQGWVSDMQFDGGGPTGELGGLRRDNALLLMLVGWEPSEDANCPQDQPISACPLEPEQMIYTITLSIAEWE